MFGRGIWAILRGRFALGAYGDIDGSPTKNAVIRLLEDPAATAIARLTLGKRPAEELYDVAADPHQMVNLAENSDHKATLEKLRVELKEWMVRTEDPRAASDDDRWDQMPYYGPPGPAMRRTQQQR